MVLFGLRSQTMSMVKLACSDCPIPNWQVSITWIASSGESGNKKHNYNLRDRQLENLWGGGGVGEGEKVSKINARQVTLKNIHAMD